MGYKVFFAFQMDIDDSFGKGFIQSAIEIAIQKFKIEGIEITLDFGFRGTPGTPLLIEEMLKKSSESDMVIVDLTFTSSKAWSEAKKIKIWGKEIKIKGKELLILDFTREKKSPNPNVLLETGYAWAKKGTYRTLVVMNEAFGSPEELPVDLKGFRWGIRYNLNEINYGDRKEVRKILGNDIYDAIKSSIKSEALYQQEKLTPIYVKSEWDKDYNYPYFLTAKVKAKIIELRALIEKSNGGIRLTGLKDTGKTRLVNELFKANGVDLIYDDKNEFLLYYDLEGPLKGDISTQLFDLRIANQQKFLILDNCPKSEHDKYVQLFKNTNVRIISIATVKSNQDTDYANVFLSEEITKEIYESMLTKKFDSVGKKVPMELVSLSLSEAITFLENNVEKETEDRTIVELLEIIIGDENIKKGALEFLQGVSLFGVIGISDRFSAEINSIKVNFLNEMSDDNLNENIQTLIAKKLLSRRGDFILTTGFEEVLIQNWWEKKKALLNQFLKKLEGTGLLNKFANRLLTTLNGENQEDLKNLLFAEGSILYDKDFSESYEGSELINKLTDKFPFEVLDLMDKKINNE